MEPCRAGGAAHGPHGMCSPPPHAQENEDLRGQVQRLEASLQQKLAQLAQLEGQVDALQWHKEEEARQLDERLCALQQALDAQLSQAPDVQVSWVWGEEGHAHTHTHARTCAQPEPGTCTVSLTPQQG